MCYSFMSQCTLRETAAVKVLFSPYRCTLSASRLSGGPLMELKQPIKFK